MQYTYNAIARTQIPDHANLLTMTMRQIFEQKQTHRTALLAAVDAYQMDRHAELGDTWVRLPQLNKLANK